MPRAAAGNASLRRSSRGRRTRPHKGSARATVAALPAAAPLGHADPGRRRLRRRAGGRRERPPWAHHGSRIPAASASVLPASWASERVRDRPPS